MNIISLLSYGKEIKYSLCGEGGGRRVGGEGPPFTTTPCLGPRLPRNRTWNFLTKSRQPPPPAPSGPPLLHISECTLSGKKKQHGVSEEKSGRWAGFIIRNISRQAAPLIFCLYCSGRWRYMAAASPFRGSMGLGYASSWGRNVSKMLVRSYGEETVTHSAWEDDNS